MKACECIPSARGLKVCAYLQAIKQLKKEENNFFFKIPMPEGMHIPSSSVAKGCRCIASGLHFQGRVRRGARAAAARGRQAQPRDVPAGPFQTNSVRSRVGFKGFSLQACTPQEYRQWETKMGKRIENQSRNQNQQLCEAMAHTE